MKVQSVTRQNFGKLYVNNLVKDKLAEEAAYTIGTDKYTNFLFVICI